MGLATKYHLICFFTQDILSYLTLSLHKPGYKEVSNMTREDAEQHLRESKYRDPVHDDVTKRKPLPHYWLLVRENSPLTGEFPSQGPATRSFDVFFDMCLNKLLDKQSRRRWFETPSRSLWRYFNVTNDFFHRNLNSMEISLCSHPSCNELLDTIFGTCHDMRKIL